MLLSGSAVASVHSATVGLPLMAVGHRARRRIVLPPKLDLASVDLAIDERLRLSLYHLGDGESKQGCE